jgi:hypothetical protein
MAGMLLPLWDSMLLPMADHADYCFKSEAYTTYCMVWPGTTHSHSNHGGESPHRSSTMQTSSSNSHYWWLLPVGLLSPRDRNHEDWFPGALALVTTKTFGLLHISCHFLPLWTGTSSQSKSCQGLLSKAVSCYWRAVLWRSCDDNGLVTQGRCFAARWGLDLVATHLVMNTSLIF